MLYQSIQHKAQRLFLPYLKAVINDESFFPKDISFRKMNAGADYARLRCEVEELMKYAGNEKRCGYTIEFKKVQHRKYGAQSLPKRVYFASEKDFCAFIGKENELQNFKQDVVLIKQIPFLHAWAQRNARRILEYHGQWKDILKVVDYFIHHPKPFLYIRQLPITVHTKFIEMHQGLLKSLLDAVLSEQNICIGTSSFEQRYYLRYEEEVIRVRYLDRDVSERMAIRDLSVPVSQAGQLPARQRVFIVENKMNFLTFPDVPDAVVIWGKGFSVYNLMHIPWLKQAEVMYWGDIDGHGFQILSLARVYFPQIKSLLMDKETFERYKEYVVTATGIGIGSGDQLTKEEQKLFRYVARNNFRLEQEKVDHAYLCQRLK